MEIGTIYWYLALLVLGVLTGFIVAWVRKLFSKGK